MPHNGRASKAGAPVKKTDPTEEERKAREEEAKKAKEKHPVGQATTREEAIEHTRSLLSPEFRETGEVEFDDSVTLEQINEINATLKELTDKYPVKTLRRIGTYVDKSDTVGAQATSKEIEFNIDHENGGIKGLHNWRPYAYDKVQETGDTLAIM